MAINVRNASAGSPIGLAAVAPLNARSLALSALLGTHPPALSARALVALAELFGIAGGAMRTALSRMAASGDVVADDGQYALAGRLIGRQTAQDVGRRGPTGRYDGSWHTVVPLADQRDLAERRTFRATMADHRFGELRPDIWMRPANIAPPPCPTPRSPARAGGWIRTTGPLDGVDASELSRRLWDLADIGRTARSLDADLRRLREHLDWSDPASIPAIFTTAAGVVRFLRHEPMLPAELLPAGWPVDALRATYDGVASDLGGLMRDFLRSA